MRYYRNPLYRHQIVVRSLTIASWKETLRILKVKKATVEKEQKLNQKKSNLYFISETMMRCRIYKSKTATNQIELFPVHISQKNLGNYHKHEHPHLLECLLQ